MRNAKIHRGGFTLIELMLVLVILGVLAAIVVPKLAGRSEEAKIKACKAEISIGSRCFKRSSSPAGRSLAGSAREWPLWR